MTRAWVFHHLKTINVLFGCVIDNYAKFITHILSPPGVIVGVSTGVTVERSAMIACDCRSVCRSDYRMIRNNCILIFDEHVNHWNAMQDCRWRQLTIENLNEYKIKHNKIPYQINYQNYIWTRQKRVRGWYFTVESNTSGSLPRTSLDNSVYAGGAPLGRRIMRTYGMMLGRWWALLTAEWEVCSRTGPSTH